MEAMTRAELRSTLESFRCMVRNRGPWECMQVATVQYIPAWLADAHPLHSEEWWQAYDEWRILGRMPRFSARAVARWWRWANSGKSWREWLQRYEAAGGRTPDYVVWPKGY